MGLQVLGASACSITVPALRYRFGGDDNGGDQNAA
jgi:hypothetical protein